MKIKPEIITAFSIGISIGATIIGALALIAIDSYQTDLDLLTVKNQRLYNQLEEKEKILSKYQPTVESLMDLGASRQQAIDIISASEAYNVSPKY